jgi:hypothetical protein
MLYRRRPSRSVAGLLVLLATLVAFLPWHPAAADPVDNLASHGGSVLLSTTTYAIYWLPSGATYEPSGSSAAYESLTQQLLHDVGATPFYNIVTQYPDGSGSLPTASSSFGGAWIDTTPYPHAGTSADPLGDADIQAAVQRALQSQGWQASASTLFLVYTGYGVQSCSEASHAQCTGDTYCAYHSFFLPSNSTQPVFYASLPDAGQNSGACLAAGSSNSSYPNGDAVADSEVSLTSMELLAAVTDPRSDGWTDSSGAETDDKCAWSFGTVGSDGSNVTLTNGHKYLLQTEWSNASSSCVLSYGSVAPTATPSGPTATSAVRSTRATPTPAGSGTATPAPTPVPNLSTRITPTPAVAGTPTSAPTPVLGRIHR